MAAMGPKPIKRWVTSLPQFDADPSPVGFEMFVLPEAALLNEFLDPPSKVGPAGQLVLALGPRRVIRRIDLDDVKLDQSVEIPGTPLTFTLKKRGHLMDLVGQEAKTKRDAVVTAITEFNRRRRLEKLAEQLDTFENVIPLDELLRLREQG